jgi:tetratricopeptide (TPR) repeat protein
MRPSVVLSLALTLALAAACGAAAPPRTAPPPDPLAAARPGDLPARGRELAGQGDHVRAEQYLSAALDRGASPDLVLPALVEVAVAGKRYRLALHHAEALGRRRDDWATAYLVATLRAGTGDAAGARRLLRAVVEEAPAAGPPRYLYAALLLAEGGRDREARQHLRAYLELEPEGDHAADARRQLRRGGRR